jgi:hypothetical protein
MTIKSCCRQLVALLLVGASLLGCASAIVATAQKSTPAGQGPTSFSNLSSPALTSTLPQTALTPGWGHYSFPVTVDPDKRYLFYLHGKIIEDQGLPAVSTDFGEYEYYPILEKLASHGFIVISEQRPKNTDGYRYAQKISGQIDTLLAARIPPEHITVIGASKGAGIAVFISYLLKNQVVNYVLLGTCHPDTIADWKQNRVSLYGNVLAIYDYSDLEYSGSCKEMFRLSAGKGLTRYDEIVLQIGSGHGFLFKPLDAWVLPAVKWANLK